VQDSDERLEHGAEKCYVCGQPAGGGEMRDGAHVLCSWGMTDYDRRRKQSPRRRGFFPTVEALESAEHE
jgi:hypothetical protein